MNSSTSQVDLALREIIILFTTIALVFCSFAFTPKAFAVDTRTCAEGGICAIGDIGPGGGTVFFVKASGSFDVSETISWDMGMGMTGTNTVSVSLTSDEQAALTFDYLEIAPYSAVVVRKWANTASWTSTATIDTRIGSGLGGTQSILEAYSSQDASNNAAHYANSYANNDQEDWFLPSQDELALVTILHFKNTLQPNDPISADLDRGHYAPNFYGWTTIPTNGPGYGAGVKIDPQWLKGVGLTAGADASVMPIRAFSSEPFTVAPAPSNSSTVVSNPIAEPELPAPIAEPELPAPIAEPATNPKPAKLQFGIGQSELPSSQRSTIRAIASEAGEGASFVVTGGVGYLPGPSTNDMLALARQRASVIQKVLLNSGVGKSNVQIKTKIYDQGTPIKTRLRVFPAPSE
jgi:hypothetical protein